jgi:integrase
MAKETIGPRATEAQIKSIKGGDRERLISDELVPNLYLVVSPLGAKSWRWQSVLDKRTRKFGIGRFPAVGLADARAKAGECNILRARGLDPREEFERLAQEAQAERQREAKALADAEANTVSKVFDAWVAWKETSKKPATASMHEYKRIIRKNFLVDYGDRAISSITKADVKAAMEVMKDRDSLGQANRFRTTLGQFFKWCVFEDYMDTNPVDKVAAYGEADPDERFLTVSEMALAYRAAAFLESDDERDAVRLLILTGTRRTAALGARSSDLDADGIWTLPLAENVDGRGHVFPVSHSKSKRPHYMQLPPLARAIFDTRHNREFLFHDAPHKYMMPDLSDKLTPLMVNLSGSPVDYWSIHKLKKGVRSALGSDEMDEMLEREGRGEVFSEDIGKIVAQHSLGALNQRYNKSTYARAVGRALAAWERLLLEEIARQEREAEPLARAA